MYLLIVFVHSHVRFMRGGSLESEVGLLIISFQVDLRYIGFD